MKVALRLTAPSSHSSLVAPAGAGKTHLIVDHVARSSTGRILILTHTNAGVAVLRRRLSAMRVPRARYWVETIAGWCLSLVRSYPTISGVSTAVDTIPPWPATYAGALTVLRQDFAQKVMQTSYTTAYVDEYQDCDLAQHAVVGAIARTVPMQVLGDPLQGILGFGDTPLVDWSQHVAATFAPVPGLGMLWRWQRNPALADFVRGVRNAIVSGDRINLRHRAVQLSVVTRETLMQAAVTECRRSAGGGGSVVAIRAQPAQCHLLSSRLRGLYSCIETVDCDDLTDFARDFEAETGYRRADLLVGFASECFTAVAPAMKSILQALAAGRRQRRANAKHADILQALFDVMEAPTGAIDPAITALELMSAVPGAKLHRRELYEALVESLRYQGRHGGSLLSAVRAVRAADRHGGRRHDRCAVGRTYLVKGLEYDRAVVMDLEQLDAANLYVALTRASQGLTILATQAVLPPPRLTPQLRAAIDAGLLTALPEVRPPPIAAR